MTLTTLLPDRAVLEIAGEDRVTFLQGLVSNDVTQATPGRAVWAALLTPQGKYVADFFIIADGARLLLDVERVQAAMLAQKLSRFRLRARVTVAEAPLHVHASWDSPAPQAGIVAADPRLPEAGWRVLAGAPLPQTAAVADWDRHRLTLGLPDGTRDMESDKTVLLEAGFDELGGVSWTKGCYLGQELTARTKYRGLLKRRLVPVRVSGALPEPGARLMRDGTDVGTMRSGRDDRGLAIIRLDALSGSLSCGESRLEPMVPGWMRLPAAS